jgi:hypothetical protein
MPSWTQLVFAGDEYQNNRNLAPPGCIPFRWEVFFTSENEPALPGAGENRNLKTPFLGNVM